MIQILQTYIWRSLATKCQILNTTIELFLEIKHFGKLFTKSTILTFTDGT